MSKTVYIANCEFKGESHSFELDSEEKANELINLFVQLSNSNEFESPYIGVSYRHKVNEAAMNSNTVNYDYNGEKSPIQCAAINTEPTPTPKYWITYLADGKFDRIEGDREYIRLMYNVLSASAWFTDIKTNLK